MAMSSLLNPDFDQERLPNHLPMEDHWKLLYKDVKALDKVCEEMVNLIRTKVS